MVRKDAWKLCNVSHTGLTWPSRARILLPDRRSHTRARASSPHDAAKDPSWWKDNPYTLLLWPSWRSNSSPVSTSHNLQVLSKLVVPKYFPDGWKAMRARRSKWPSNVLKVVPVLFHNLAVRSADAVAKILSVGENAISVARSVCPFKVETFVTCGMFHILATPPKALSNKQFNKLTNKRTNYQDQSHSYWRLKNHEWWYSLYPTSRGTLTIHAN